MHVAADCYGDNSQWLLTRVQGGCLEPKWLRPFWYSAALILTISCFHPIGGVGGVCGSATLGTSDHPNFRKNALGVKRPFSELSESSGVFSEQLSELEIPFSEYEIPFSEWPLTT